MPFLPHALALPSWQGVSFAKLSSGWGRKMCRSVTMSPAGSLNGHLMVGEGGKTGALGPPRLAPHPLLCSQEPTNILFRSLNLSWPCLPHLTKRGDNTCLSRLLWEGRGSCEAPGLLHRKNGAAVTSLGLGAFFPSTLTIRDISSSWPHRAWGSAHFFFFFFLFLFLTKQRSTPSSLGVSGEKIRSLRWFPGV